MEHKVNHSSAMMYRKFGIMLLVSLGIMYLVMFLNMSSVDHFHNSVSRFYMAILMVAPMAIVMLLMMGKMYTNKKKNMIIMLSAAIVFSLALAGLRAQVPVGDVQYMKAMIPHHSSAIMTSRNASISDPEVKKLSEKIISSQEEEIAVMERLINKLSD